MSSALVSPDALAEAAQIIVNANQRPNSGVHNGVRTREQLKKYDPEICKVLVEIFPVK